MDLSSELQISKIEARAPIEPVHTRATIPSRTIDFFETFLSPKVVRESEKLGRKITVLAHGDQSNLSILYLPPAVQNVKPENAGINQLGFTEENIHDLAHCLKESGYLFPWS